MFHIVDVKDKKFLSQLPAAIADCQQLQGGRVTLSDHLSQYAFMNSRVYVIESTFRCVREDGQFRKLVLVGSGGVPPPSSQLE